MPRIFLLDSDPSPGTVTVRGDKARYLTTVLRSRAGDHLVVRDTKGNSYSARISRASSQDVVMDILERLEVDTESPLRVTLIQGLLKGEKMDLVIQKTTELGVAEIIPVVTERSQVRETRKLPRWKKIAEEASRQSGRTVIPLVHEVVPLEAVVTCPTRVHGKGIIFWEEGGMAMTEIADRFRGAGSLSIITGPEGGFSEKEVTTATGHGYAAATLGRRILRAETAALTALSVIQYALGDLGK